MREHEFEPIPTRAAEEAASVVLPKGRTRTWPMFSSLFFRRHVLRPNPEQVFDAENVTAGPLRKWRFQNHAHH